MDAADILLYNTFSHKLEYAAGQGFRTLAVTRTHIPMNRESIAGRVAMECRAIQVNQLAEEGDGQARSLVHIRRGALLHDIGKMGIPDSILLKTGSLEMEEVEVMHRHPVIARTLLATIRGDW